MIRELDFSRITLRIIEHVDKDGDGDDDHVIAKLVGNTIDTLRRALYTPTQLVLKDKHGRENKITVSLKYIPVEMRLDPSESFNNQGTLRVDVLDAADLPAADRNGYSDPYCTSRCLYEAGLRPTLYVTFMTGISVKRPTS
jgi:Ca2+-dependent lipid-binding protein